jgi:hypothetical protein
MAESESPNLVLAETTLLVRLRENTGTLFSKFAKRAHV